jgi:hypothetical protein
MAISAEKPVTVLVEPSLASLGTEINVGAAVPIYTYAIPLQDATLMSKR